MPNAHLSVSSRKTFQRCPREFKFKYVDGYKSVQTAQPLYFGSLIHRALEAWMKYDDQSTQMWDAIHECSADPEADIYDVVSAEELIRGYHARWGGEPIKTIATEIEFNTPILNPETGRPSQTYTLKGYIDAIVEKGGEQWIVEHKTSGQDITPGSVYWQKLRLDTQVSTYFVGARSLGFDPVGCIYDVVGKPTNKPHKATPVEKRKTKKDGSYYANVRLEDEKPDDYRLRLRDHIIAYPDRYYQRGEVFRLESEELDAAHDMWQATKIIRGNQLANRWPRNTDACFQWNRACDYWPVCTGECGLDNDRYSKVESEDKPTMEDGNESTKQ